MGCRCTERRRRIIAATKAAIRGDATEAFDHLARIIQTVREDARDLRTTVVAYADRR